MTQNKVQKRAIRARMDKTGERYTTARHYLLDLRWQREDNGREDVPDEARSAPSAEGDIAPEVVAAVLPPRMAEPMVSDAAVQRATGKSWDEWFALLDAWQGMRHSHPEIARHLHEMHAVDGWWAQNVTVGYERARGMRALHERPDGFFSVNASKTFPVPVERLFAAFVEEAERERWLDGVALRLRTVHRTARRASTSRPARRASPSPSSRGPQKSVAQRQ
jgi:hypothetical protein